MNKRKEDVVLTSAPTPTQTTPTGNKSILSKSKSSLYSEPVDAIVFRRNTNYRHSEPNIRWSQPAMMSLLNVDNHLPDIPQSPDHGIVDEDQELRLRKHQQHLRNSLLNVNSPRPEEDSGKENNGGTSGKETIKTRNSPSQGVTCVSVDNLCHLRDIRKRTKSKFNCGGGGGEGSDEEEETVVLENKQVHHVSPGVDGYAPSLTAGSIQNFKNGSTTANKNIGKFTTRLNTLMKNYWFDYSEQDS